MEPIFRVEREKQDFLFYKEYENDRSVWGFHSHIELYFVDDGEMDITVNYHHRRMRKGEMCVVLNFDAHGYVTPEHSKSSVLIIPLYMCAEFIEATKHKRVVSPFICNKETVAKIKGYIKELNECDSNEILKQGYIYVILGIVMENIFFENAEEAMDAKISSKLLMYIDEHFREDINLELLSAKFGYNQSYLSRFFKQCFNITFSQYLTTVRLKNALMLMHENQHNLTYCAYESGFNSMRTFYRCFKNEFKCTPKEYAAGLRNQL